MNLSKKLLFLIIIVILFLVGCTANKTSNISNENKYVSKHNFEIIYPKNWHLESYIENYKNLDKAIKEHQNSFYIFSYDPEVSLPGQVTNKQLKIVSHVFNDISLAIDEWIYAKDGFFDDKNVLSIDEIIMENGTARKVIWETKDKKEKQMTIFYKEGKRGAIFIAYPFDSNLMDQFYQIVRSFKFN